MTSTDTQLFPISKQDLAALQAIQDAMMACNAANTYHLQLQPGGTYGRVHDAFIDAATHLIGADNAERLMYYLIDSGESVAYCLDLVRSELCGACEYRIDNTDHHCSECGTCTGHRHSTDCSERSCLGHETLNGPAGIAAYCDGSCRNPYYVGL